MRRAPRLGPSLAAALVFFGAASASAQTSPPSPATDQTVGQLSPPIVTTDPVVRSGSDPEPRLFGRSVGSREPRSGGSLLGHIGRDYAAFFTSRETYLTLGLGLGTSLSLRPLDESITTSRFNAELFEDTTIDRAFEGGQILGGALFQIGGAFAAYGAGVLTGKSEVTELGRDLVRVQLLTQGVTQAIKYSVGRARPDASSHSSFPSGHASGTFATATVFHRRYGWKAGLPAYGIASWVAASRLSENKHFLSDVIFGAAIGIAAGRAVTWDRGSTRFAIEPMAAPGGAGVQMTVRRR